MNYFICGFSGAGKSFLIEQLQLQPILKNYEFLDLDEYIFGQYAISRFENLGDYIRSVGFEKFREDEFSSLKKLAKKRKLILSLGGGTLTEKTMDFLKEHAREIQCLWLATPFEKCYERIKGDRNRPLSSSSETELEELYNHRLKDYKVFVSINNAEQVIEIIKNQDL